MNRRKHLPVVVASFAIAGLSLLALLQAANPARRVALEAELGNPVGGEIRSISSASRGQYFEFGDPDSGNRLCRNPVIIRPPATNFAQQVAGAAEGTCFRLTSGTYNFLGIRPKNNMIFEGQSRASVIIDGSGQASQINNSSIRANCYSDVKSCDLRHAFISTASNVTIRKMTFRNFKWRNSSGNVWQELTPIIGKQYLFDNGPNGKARIRATNWLIDDIWSHDNVASGLHVGDDFIVRNSKFYNNGITGISGDRFTGGLIEDNEVYGNAAGQAGGVFVNGGGMKFVFASGVSANDPLILRNNIARDNLSVGIWCDLDCNHVLIENNIAFGNYIIWTDGRRYGRAGIFYEISRNATIRNNTVVNSSQVDWPEEGCIKVAGSTNIVVENNTTRDCYNALSIKEDKRPFSSELSAFPDVWDEMAARTGGKRVFMSERVTFRNNTVRNSHGVGMVVNPGAKSVAGHAQRLNTINYRNNNYDNPGGMTFYWDERELNYSQWRGEHPQD